MAPSALAHTVRQMINPETDDSLFRVSWGMECQSVSNMIYTSRSPSGPPSALLNHDGLTAWSGPGHTTPTSDHSDRRSFGLLFNHPEGAPSRRSVSQDFLFIFDLDPNVLSDRSGLPQKMGKLH